MKSMDRARRTHESRNAFGVLMGKPEQKEAVGRPRRRWEDSNRVDLTVI
jgi:hypothetical protein